MVSGMVEYRPWGTKTDNGRLDFGGYLRAEYGAGEAGTKSVSDYTFMKYGFGLNAKFWHKEAYDVNFRVGYKHEHDTAKGSTANYDFVEAAINVHSDQGRVAKRSYLTEGDLFVQVVQPVSYEKKSDTGAKLATDEKRATDVKLQVGITDIKLDGANILVPLVGVGTGTTGVGVDEKTKVNYMLGLKWKNKGHDRLTAKVENEHIDGGRVNTTGSVTLSFEF